MGGLACWARFSAWVPFESPPTDPVLIPQYDAGMRQFWAAPDVPESLERQQALKSLPPALSDVMKKICATLKKRQWSQADREFLHETAESLYE